jgi:ketosteroid isomerase-like protein
MSEENVERLRGLYAEWAKGNFRGGRELFAADATFEPRLPDQRATLKGDAFQVHLREFLTRWSEFRIEAEQFAEFGDIVLVTERQHGTGKSSGAETDATVYAAWTFREGLISRVCWDVNLVAALEAAGLSE